jgi:hypothetical protein
MVSRCHNLRYFSAKLSVNPHFNHDITEILLKVALNTINLSHLSHWTWNEERQRYRAICFKPWYTSRNTNFSCEYFHPIKDVSRSAVYLISFEWNINIIADHLFNLTGGPHGRQYCLWNWLTNYNMSTTSIIYIL